MHSDSDREGNAALMRAPAALAAAAFLLGLVTGQFARLTNAPAPSTLALFIALLVCAPFLLPTPWYRHRALWIWMAAAAAFASVRAVALAGWLLPHQPWDAWIVKTIIDLVVAAMLWLAVAAAARVKT